MSVKCHSIGLLKLIPNILAVLFNPRVLEAVGSEEEWLLAPRYLLKSVLKELLLVKLHLNLEK